jgi:hypothetical protein
MIDEYHWINPVVLLVLGYHGNPWLMLFHKFAYHKTIKAVLHHIGHPKYLHIPKFIQPRSPKILPLKIPPNIPISIGMHKYLIIVSDHQLSFII